MTTYDLSTLRDLLVRVEAATVPDADLELRLAEAFDTFPPVASSIDAAVDLIERVMPGSYWIAGFAPPGFEETGDNMAQIFTESCAEMNMSKAATPALALIAALLNALIAREEGREPDAV